MPVTASLSRAQIVALLGNDPIDNNGGIGSIIFGQHYQANVAIVAGSLYAGSSIIRGDVSAAGSGAALTVIVQALGGGNLAGTWRALTSSAAAAVSYSGALFQRIV